MRPPVHNSQPSAARLLRWRESGINCGRMGLPGLADVVLATRNEAERQAYLDGLAQGRQDREAGITEPLREYTGTRPLRPD